ncbi:unnamed protein product [Rangifer tarandus platyrhynchus]|uniref:Uncharacterized protein n=1 Tax=Rangifer tarandus platyrhynchus TaxID=3082113 RepID=A0AC59ZVG4_RANTA
MQDTRRSETEESLCQRHSRTQANQRPQLNPETEDNTADLFLQNQETLSMPESAMHLPGGLTCFSLLSCSRYSSDGTLHPHVDSSGTGGLGG